MNTLVLTAHGSKDPRSVANVLATAACVRMTRPDLDVRVAFCEHNTPSLPDVLARLQNTDRAVLTPLLLASAYHARIDIPQQVAGCGAAIRQAEVLGDDDRLVRVLHERLTELGVDKHDPGVGVVVVAVGSSHRQANVRTAEVTYKLAAGTRWLATATAFATGSRLSVAHAVHGLRRQGADRVVIAPWFVAAGRLTDRVHGYANDLGVAMAKPLGAHPLVAETLLDRYDRALAGSAAA